MRSRSKWARMRSGSTSRRKPQVWIPLAPGPQGTTGSRTFDTSKYLPTNGSIVEFLPDQGWLFAITPELTDGDAGASVMGLGGAIDSEQAYRVVGLKGNLSWTPQYTLSDPNNDVSAWSGWISLWWYKVEASLAGAVPSADSPLRYPWSAGWLTKSNTEGNFAQGFVTNYHAVTLNSGPSALRNKDPRYRVDVMHHVRKPWSLNVMPIIDGADVISNLTMNQRAVSLPLPRKVVCNVGRGEALACAYQVVSDSNVPSASSPGGLFTFSDMKVLVHELD